MAAENYLGRSGPYIDKYKGTCSGLRLIRSPRLQHSIYVPDKRRRSVMVLKTTDACFSNQHFTVRSQAFWSFLRFPTCC